MATNILMPALSPTMTEGTLARWLKKEGETIKAGDVIAEIETDKATMEVEAVDEGVLGKILVGDGTEGVKVNEPIAVLVSAGEAVPATAASTRQGRVPGTGTRCQGVRRRSRAYRSGIRFGPRAGRGNAPAERSRGGRGTHLRLAVGPPHGGAGRHRPDGLEGQRTERTHSPGGHRGSPERRAGALARAASGARSGGAAHPRPHRPPRSARRTGWCRTVRCEK